MIRLLPLLVLLAVGCRSQTKTPQFEIIPYQSGTQGILRFFEQRSNGTNYIQFRAPVSLSTNFDLNWPVPSANSIWYTDSSFQNVANTSTFVFDGATGRLGVGTATPLQRIDADTGSIRGGSYVFAAGSTYSVGATGARAANMFTDFFTISDPPTGGVVGNLIPISDNTYDLGSIGLGRRWRNAYFSNDLQAGNALINGDIVAGQIRSLLPSTYSLGTNSNRWVNGFFDYLTLSSGFAQGFASNVVPSGDNLYALGNGSQRWATLNVAGTITSGNIATQTASTFSLGTNSNRWANIFTDNLTISSGAGQGIVGNLNPITNYVYTLGDANYRWNVMWGRFVSLRTNGSNLAGFSGRDSSNNEVFYLGDGGGIGGEMRINDSALSEAFGVVNGNVRFGGSTGLTSTFSCPAGQAVKGMTITKGGVISVTCAAP